MVSHVLILPKHLHISIRSPKAERNNFIRLALLAKVEAGITHVPFAQGSASGPGAIAEAGVSWKYTGASAGACAGKARAVVHVLARAYIKL